MTSIYYLNCDEIDTTLELYARVLEEQIPAPRRFFSKKPNRKNAIRVLAWTLLQYGLKKDLNVQVPIETDFQDRPNISDKQCTSTDSNAANKLCYFDLANSTKKCPPWSSNAKIILENNRPKFDEYPNIVFSISHSDSAIMVAISYGEERFKLGCDVENIDRFKNISEIFYKKAFTPNEDKLLKELKLKQKSSRLRQDRFIEGQCILWTATEAHEKAFDKGIDRSSFSHDFSKILESCLDDDNDIKAQLCASILNNMLFISFKAHGHRFCVCQSLPNICQKTKTDSRDAKQDMEQNAQQDAKQDMLPHIEEVTLKRLVELKKMIAL